MKSLIFIIFVVQAVWFKHSLALDLDLSKPVEKPASATYNSIFKEFILCAKTFTKNGECYYLLSNNLSQELMEKIIFVSRHELKVSRLYNCPKVVEQYKKIRNADVGDYNFCFNVYLQTSTSIGFIAFTANKTKNKKLPFQVHSLFY